MLTSIVVWDGRGAYIHCFTALVEASARMGLPPQPGDALDHTLRRDRGSQAHGAADRRPKAFLSRKPKAPQKRCPDTNLFPKAARLAKSPRELTIPHSPRTL
jgi:hypothetical protein